MTKYFVQFCALILCTSSFAVSQQAVAPPPKPTDGGPSLPVTMQFIQEKLNDIGTVDFVAIFHDTTAGNDPTNHFIHSVTHVVADPNQCKLSFHFKVTRDGAVTGEGDYWFMFRDVNDVVVKPWDQFQNEQNASGGVPNLVTQSVNPPLTALVIRRPHGVLNFFAFGDPQLADRVAKAVTHAVELCGGGNKDPF